MLADARHLVPGDISARSGKWEKKRFMGREITGKTVGLLGLGYIGRLVAKRLSGFEVKLLGYDPIVTAEQARRSMSNSPISKVSLVGPITSRCTFRKTRKPRNWSV